MLCQTLNAEFSAKGIHIVHILIDGATFDIETRQAAPPIEAPLEERA